MKKSLLMVIATIFAVAGFSEAQAFFGCGCNEPKPKKEACCNEFVPKRCTIKTCKRVSKCEKCNSREDMNGEEMNEDVAAMDSSVASAREHVKRTEAQLKEARKAEHEATGAQKAQRRAERLDAEATHKNALAAKVRAEEAVK